MDNILVIDTAAEYWRRIIPLLEKSDIYIDRTGNLDSARRMIIDNPYSCIVSEYEVPPGSDRFYGELKEKSRECLCGIVTNWDVNKLRFDGIRPDFVISKFRKHAEIAHHLYTAVNHPEDFLGRSVGPMKIRQWCNPIKYPVEYLKA